MELTDNMKEWLAEMYRDAAKEARATADNERTWADGSPDEETRDMHARNAEEQEKYASHLDELAASL